MNGAEPYLFKKRAVVKFGGAELRSGESFKQVAEMIKAAGFEEVAVVVFAMEKTTDSLINYVRGVGRISEADYADIVSMGERISARIFCLALKALGLNSVYFDPQGQDWPIMTDSNFLEAEPDFEETKGKVKTHVEPLLKSCIPEVCGFVGRDKEGRVTLLGRGGSDITATLLGNCLNADEVILVKNTEGVLSADPSLVPDAEPLKEKIGAIEVLSPEFIEYPGWVAKISKTLAERGINIVEISSSKATITVFLEEKDLEKALEAIKTASD